MRTVVIGVMMRISLILLMLTLTVNATRYNLVNDELTKWTDLVYLDITDEQVTLVSPQGIVLKGPRVHVGDKGGNLIAFTNTASKGMVVLNKKGFIIVLIFEDDDGRIVKLKFIEGVEYGDG